MTNAQTLFLMLGLQWASYLGVWLLCVYGERRERALEPKP
jgi:hypothetical protein